MSRALQIMNTFKAAQNDLDNGISLDFTLIRVGSILIYIKLCLIMLLTVGSILQ